MNTARFIASNVKNGLWKRRLVDVTPAKSSRHYVRDTELALLNYTTDSTNALDELETNMEPISEDIKEEVDLVNKVLESDTQNVSVDKNKTKKLEINDAEEKKLENSLCSTAKPKKSIVKDKRKKTENDQSNPAGRSSYDSTQLEDSPAQVLDRFKRGCECADDQCFKNLNPEIVYRHRLNIAELTKAEHDMYLMGVTMACLTDPYQTARHTERRRLRAQYVYQGRRVCLEAFLYLENCTHYQIKRIRKHLMTHGVTPRVHGNQGKIPHNTFSLDIYKIATQFLKNFVDQQEARQKTKLVKNAPLHLPPDITRKTVHELYIRYCKEVSPNVKSMGYSTFRRFMKVQFPQVKFAKLEFVVRNQTTQSHCQTESSDARSDMDQQKSSQVEGGTILPLVITNNLRQNETYVLTPISKLQDGMSYHVTTCGLVVNSPTKTNAT